MVIKLELDEKEIIEAVRNSIQYKFPTYSLLNLRVGNGEGDLYATVDMKPQKPTD